MSTSSTPILSFKTKESPLGDDEDCSSLEHFDWTQNHRRRCHWQAVTWRICSFSVQLGFCILLILNLTLDQAKANQRLSSSNKQEQRITDRYGNDVEYMSLESEFDHLWEEDLNGTKGMIRLNPEQVNADPQWGSIAMFHQLHCLAAIRDALQRAKRGEDIGMTAHDDDHWPHCFWYLRQAVLCFAEDTIEFPALRSPEIQSDGSIAVKRLGFIDGANDLRVCKDYEKLYELDVTSGQAAEAERTQYLNKVQGKGEQEPKSN